MPLPLHFANGTRAFRDGHVFIVAEIGKNFIQTEAPQPLETSLENAKRLIDAAADAGADAVKFQTHEVEDEQLDLHVVSPHFTGADRYSWVKRNTEETPDAFWREVKAHADARGILFFSTPMSRRAAEKLSRVGADLWKVGSGDVLDFVLLRYLARTGKPIIISTGMVSKAELDRVAAFLRAENAPFAILYCVSKYPCPPGDFNLALLDYLRGRYPDVPIGFSDHAIGYDVSLAAVKKGAMIIEKHFSMSRDLWGADHKVSMTPAELAAMVVAIRSGQAAGTDAAPYEGSKEAEFEGAQNQFRPYFHKSLMAGQAIPKGAVIQEGMIFAMRPQMYAGGVPSDALDRVIGKRALRDIAKYEPLNAGSVEGIA